jgi:phosphate-selective porin OprO/OprP
MPSIERGTMVSVSINRLGVKIKLISIILASIMCTQAPANDSRKYGIDGIDLGATLTFQREWYRGVLTDNGLTNSSSFLRKADVKAKIPLFDKTIFKLKLKVQRSDKITATDAYINSELMPGLSIRAGRYDPEFSHELTGSSSWTTAVERSSIYDLLALSGDGSDGEGISLNYSTDAFHGNFTLYNIPNTLFYSTRLVLLPIHENTHRLTFGYSATFTEDPVANDGEIKSSMGFWSLDDNSDTNLIKLAESVDDDTIIDNLEMGLELTYLYHNILFQAEYVRRDYTSPDKQITTLAEGFSLQLAYSLTGNPRRFNKSNATYKGLKPIRHHAPFPGAWEVFLRYEDLESTQESQISLNNYLSEEKQANVYTIGINWYFLEDLRISTSYSRVYAPADDNDEGQIRGTGMALRTLLTF